MKVFKAIPCFKITHNAAYGSWHLEPAFAAGEHEIGVVNVSGTEDFISIMVEELNIKDAFCLGVDKIINE